MKNCFIFYKLIDETMRFNFRYVIHADGSSLNTTDSHRWAIHNNPPGKDFYDWQGRCLSTNQVYNPYKV